VKCLESGKMKGPNLVFEMGSWIEDLVREVSDYDKSISRINGVDCGVPSLAN